MNHQTSSLRADDGNSLHYQSWWPATPPIGVILVVHGVAEHGGRYADFAGRACAAGIGVAAIDLPGHGQSSGERCCIRDFSQYTDAVETARIQALKELDERRIHRPADQNVARAPTDRDRVIFLGHSMGGLVLARYLQRVTQHRESVAGAVFSGAALKVDPEPPAVQVKIMSVLAKLFPRLGALSLDGTKISRDDSVVSDYFSDPLVFNGKLSTSLLSAMFKALTQAQRELDRIQTPLLILHGSADELVPPAASSLLHERASSTDKTHVEFPGLYHEILNEPERDQVAARVLDWATQRFLADRP